MPRRKFTYSISQVRWLKEKLDSGLQRTQIGVQFSNNFTNGSLRPSFIREFLRRNFPQTKTTDVSLQEYLKRKAELKANPGGGNKGGKKLFYYTPEAVDWMAQRLLAGKQRKQIIAEFVEMNKNSERKPSPGHLAGFLSRVFRQGVNPLQAAKDFRAAYKTRGQIRREIEERQSPSVRNRVAIANVLRTHKERSRTVKEMWAKIGKVERSARGSKGLASLPPEERRKVLLRAWVTRKAAGTGRRRIKKQRALPHSTYDRRGWGFQGSKLPEGVAFDTDGQMVPVVEDKLPEQDRSRLAAELLASLSAQERKVVELKVFGSKSFPEIARIAKLSKVEVQKMFNAAIQKLRNNPLSADLFR